MERKTVTKLGLVVAGLGLGYFVFKPDWTDERGPAPKTRAVVRAKAVATATILYLGDYDDRFPPFDHADEVADKLSPYFPKSGYDGIHLNYKGEATTYIWNADLSGYHLVEENNARSWMFYNPQEFDGRKLLAHVDSSVKGLKPDELREALSVKLNGSQLFGK